jgi:hypothetical protein
MNIRKLGQAAAVVVATLAGLTTNAIAFTIDGNVEGFWYESGITANRGWGFQYLPTGPEQGVLFVAGYVYDDVGEAVWLVGQAEVFDGDYEVDLPLLAFSGGAFGPGTGAPSSTAAGNLNVVFNSCSSADFTFTGVPGVDDYSQEFQPFLDIVSGPGQDRCVYQKEFTGCPAFAQDLGDRNCGIGGTLTEDVTLTNDTVWVLTSALFVGPRAELGDPVPENGPTLTIEPGTRIIGTKAGRVALVVSRGSRIVADGLPYAPIVMTGENYESTGALASDWGGLVINGAAPINTCDAGVCEAVGEGDSGAYGGDDPYDNSGVLRYVRVQFAGDKVTDEDELNGIAFQGVGSGTVVDYVQVHRNADDAVEFFGGTVNAKHLFLTDNQDDSVDWTQGYSGKLQYVFVKQIQDPGVETDHGMELDNLEQNHDATPRAQPRMANFTFLGKAGKNGILARRGTGGNFSNFIVTGFGDCLDIDDDATFAAAGTPGALSGVLTMENTIFDCATSFTEEAGDAWSVADFFNTQPGNSERDPALDLMFPPQGAEYTSGYELDPMVYDDFFEDVDYIGAFRSRESAWHYNWTEFFGD